MKKSAALVIAVIYVLAIFILPAQAEWLHNKIPVTDSPYAKTDGAFGAMLLFTDKPDELFDAWNKEGLEVQASLVEKAKLNKELVAVIIFSNSAVDRKGNSNVTAVLTILDPQDKPIGGGELKVWVNRPAPAYRDLELSVDNLRFTIQEGMPLGLYTVKAMVYDKVAGKILNLEHQFEVINKEN